MFKTLAQPAGVLLAGLLLLPTLTAQRVAPSYSKAEMFYRHGLVVDAKRELIQVIHSRINDAPRAYYLLATIAFEENRVGEAVRTWNELRTRYPDSAQAQAAASVLKTVAETLGSVQSKPVHNARAKAFLRYAGFWSKGKGSTLMVNTMQLPRVKAAVFWYNRAIAEFPGTEAARQAHLGKVRTLIGWRDGIKTFGVLRDFETYMPKLLTAFAAFEAGFRKDPSLQAMRFQIAQLYLNAGKDKDKATAWFSSIIKSGMKGESFYVDLAQRMLRKLAGG